MTSEKKYKRSPEVLNDMIERIIEIADSIKVKGVTVLTGNNASGKSLVRKQLLPGIAKQLKKNPEKDKNIIASTSQQRRTESRPEFGGLGGAMMDLPWLATSQSTVSQIQGALATGAPYVVIDEPEIGMGEELQIGIAEYLNRKIAETETLRGVLVITHSRLVVQHLKSDHFINMQGLDRDAWLSRPIVAKDPDELDAEGSELHGAIQDRINENKRKKDEK